MSRGFSHGDGWFDILWRLCENLEPLVDKFEKETGLQFEVLQVKEKFGGLRIHVNYATDAIRQRIEAAEEESSLACEICGNWEYGEKSVGLRLYVTSMQSLRKQEYDVRSLYAAT